MKKLIISVFLIAGITTYAQTDGIEKLCQDYDQKITKAIEEEMPEALPSIKVSCFLSKRAIGPVNHLITIYFDEHEMEITGEEQEDPSFHKEAVIRKAEFTLSSGSYTDTYSYYFNEGGILIKYQVETEGYSCYKKEVYFDEKGAIRETLTPNDNGPCPQEDNPKGYDKTELSKQEKASASWFQEDANKFRQILFLNYELMKD